MHQHLPTWISLLEKSLKRPLEPTEIIFPYIGPNGVIYTQKEMTHDQVQKHLTELTEGTGLKGSFTTHCLRRGGAQYWFMFAPLGQRWSLSVIRWWGGWSIGEHVSLNLAHLRENLMCSLFLPGRHPHPVPGRHVAALREHTRRRPVPHSNRDEQELQR